MQKKCLNGPDLLNKWLDIYCTSAVFFYLETQVFIRCFDKQKRWEKSTVTNECSFIQCLYRSVNIHMCKSFVFSLGLEKYDVLKGGGGISSFVVAGWTAVHVNRSSDRSCTRGMIHYKIQLILGRLSSAQYSHTVQNGGLRHHSFIMVMFRLGAHYICGRCTCCHGNRCPPTGLGAYGRRQQHTVPGL